MTTAERYPIQFEERSSLPEYLVRDLAPLVEAHYREVSPLPDVPLDVDWDAYRSALAARVYRLFLMIRTVPAIIRGSEDPEHGAIIMAQEQIFGYAGFYVTQHLHTRSIRQALCDVIYIRPSHRGSAAHFIRWCDARLAQSGVSVVYQHVTDRRDFGPVLESLGYVSVEHTYARRLV